MAFFRSFQQSLPSVSSILDSVSTAVDDLTSAVGDVTYSVSDQLAEQVSTLINKVHAEEGEEEEGVGREEEASGQTGRCKSSLDRSRDRETRNKDHGMRPAHSVETSTVSDHYQSPVEGVRGEGCRKKNSQKIVEAGARSEILVEEGRSHSSPKGKAPKHGDNTSKRAWSPSDHNEAGKRSQKFQEETACSSENRVTGKDNLTPNGETINGACQSDSGRESPAPYSKLAKERTRQQTKANVEERMEEENSKEEEMVSDTMQTHSKETGVLPVDSKSPKSGKEKEDTKKAARARKSQKDASGKNPRMGRDDIKKEKSRQNTGEGEKVKELL